MRRLRRGPPLVVRDERDGGRLGRRPRPVRPPASGPGIGRPGRQRRRPAHGLQGPRAHQQRPRRAAAAVAPGPPRDRPLPLLDDRVDGLGERPAYAPPRTAPGARHRPQRQPRQYPGAPRLAGRRSGPPAGLDRHGAPDRPPGRRAGGRYRRCAHPGPAPHPRCVQPRRPRRAAGHRRPRPARLPAARPRPAPRAGALRRPAAAVGRRRGRRRLVPLVGDRRARHRRGRVRPRRAAGRDGRPRGGPRATLGPIRPGRSGAVRLRAHLLRPARLVHGGPQPLRGAPEDGDGARPRASGRDRHGHAGPRHRGGRRRRLRRGVRHPVPGRPRPQSLHRADVHPAVPDDAPAGGDDQAQPAPRGRPRPAPDGGRRLDRPGHDDEADRRPPPEGGGDRGPRPDQRAAHLPPVLLRHRHADRDRAHRRLEVGRGDPRVHRRRFPRLPLDRRRPRRPRPAVRAVLLRLLRRPLPGAGPVRRARAGSSPSRRRNRS